MSVMNTGGFNPLILDRMLAVWYSVGIFLLLQVVFPEASAAAGHTIDRVISIMDAEGLTLGKLTGFAQRVSPLCI
jgi:hypothetical protein